MWGERKEADYKTGGLVFLCLLSSVLMRVVRADEDGWLISLSFVFSTQLW